MRSHIQLNCTVLCSYLCHCVDTHSLQTRNANENSTNVPPATLPFFVEGRDGRDGRDGQPGLRGPVGSDGVNGTRGETGAPGPQGPPGPSSGGVTYVRWGRTSCPDTEGTELVYMGRAAGSLSSHSGGGSNYQCVVEDPENFDFGPGTVSASFMYGAEYRMSGNVPSSNLPLNSHDVPCAVCYVTERENVLVVPGTYVCPGDWTREYYGYLMAERYSHYRSTFECMDVDAETEISGRDAVGGALFYHVEPRCGSLPCPRYKQEEEMTCCVCSR